MAKNKAPKTLTVDSSLISRGTRTSMRAWIWELLWFLKDGQMQEGQARERQWLTHGDSFGRVMYESESKVLALFLCSTSLSELLRLCKVTW